LWAAAVDCLTVWQIRCLWSNTMACPFHDALSPHFSWLHIEICWSFPSIVPFNCSCTPLNWENNSLHRTVAYVRTFFTFFSNLPFFHSHGHQTEYQETAQCMLGNNTSLSLFFGLGYLPKCMSRIATQDTASRKVLVFPA
jgi:hypothetical protein